MFQFLKQRQIVLFWVLVCSFLFPSLSFSQETDLKGSLVVLEKPLDADQHLEDLEQQAKEQGNQIESVEITHIGKRIPLQLQYLIDRLHGRKIPIHFSWIKNPELLTQKIDQLIQTDQTEVPQIYEKLRYEMNQENALAILPQFDPQKFREKTSKINLHIKHFFGLLNGVSWETYHVKRSSKMKLTEASIAVGKNLFSSFLMYEILKKSELTRGDLNTTLPVLISAGFGLAFDYWQQGNSAFKGQGKSFDFRTKRFEVNRKFMALVQLVHSFVVRQSVLLATGLLLTSDKLTNSLPDFVSSLQFQFRWEAVVPFILPTMVVTLTGFLSKSFPELLLERLRVKKGQLSYIVGNTAWSLLCTSLVTMNQFEYGAIAKTTLMVLGGAGLLYESSRAARNPSSWAYRTFNKILDWSVKQDSKADCETHLIIKKSVLTNEI